MQPLLWIVLFSLRPTTGRFVNFCSIVLICTVQILFGFLSAYGLLFQIFNNVIKIFGQDIIYPVRTSLYNQFSLKLCEFACYKKDTFVGGFPKSVVILFAAYKPLEYLLVFVCRNPGTVSANEILCIVNILCACKYKL